MVVESSEDLSSANYPGIQGSSVLVLKLWYRKARKLLLGRGRFVNPWERVGGCAVSELGSFSTGCNSVSRHHLAQFSHASSGLLLHKENSSHQTTPSTFCSQTDRLRVTTLTVRVSVEQVCVLPTGEVHSLQLGPLMSVSPICLASSFLCIDMLKLPTSGCWHVLVFLPETPSAPDLFS